MVEHFDEKEVYFIYLEGLKVFQIASFWMGSSELPPRPRYPIQSKLFKSNSIETLAYILNNVLKFKL